ncbi:MULTISPECIES: GH1 family beta-glucosidase [unclassified Rhodococcus (in: high G+C Gram-positive bacteria)]|uniref:GH1 family beta-glucosidase n=1 Tax=unclassified Rhodococcus (in: high G+C Gram-positive bacteria) TaxID=192944 RepID=UPI0024B6760C|nr:MULTISPECIES: GH1 family beta-glucosidase [unclassified Rhodococcus (in: high G+C Gram-positive bacteria)]MDI9956475.1 GH1 family beta-glucosidase [Rhodococcus sp. IEGM 1237]MDI9964115.1 GH1 family beta-glucosidase [Rhodococcus sp. IEGM 1251]MDV8124470.1 GH1 family beta-glucosidase [Rhodococcus sp. IEGM 1304]
MTRQPTPEFPSSFVWGTATAAYQIEGAVAEDGRGPSIWDEFCDRPGVVVGGDTGTVAADHYHRWESDIDLMQQLGLDAYRLSLSWSRILPTGSGAVNAKGLDFYDRLVDRLCAVGITPAVTLFHWDLPLALQEQGGWMNRDTSYRLGEYAQVVGERLSDRVGMWMPLNEPVVHTLYGHALGVHAPGLALGFEAFQAAHHQLLGHGLAVEALRATGCTNIGIASNHAPVRAASDSPEDVMAADIYDHVVNWMFADPVLVGKYPADEFAQLLSGPVDEDLKIIGAPLDWYGINYYEPTMIAAPVEGQGTEGVLEVDLPPGLPFAPVAITGYPTTDFGWPIVPEGLGEILRTFQARFGDALPPIYITESGCSFHDAPDAAGVVEDKARIDYHDAHLRALRSAIDDGVDVRGYFVWSLLDNFEWAAGYKERFGLVHVDFGTQKRTPKASFEWYRALIAEHKAAQV